MASFLAHNVRISANVPSIFSNSGEHRSGRAAKPLQAQLRASRFGCGSVAGSRFGEMGGIRVDNDDLLRMGRERKGVVTMVIPYQKGEAWQQPPPDLPSYLYKNRIVFLGMSLVPEVTELIMAELLYLQYEDKDKPIYMYINSTGTTKEGQKLGYETEAFAIYDTMRYVVPPIFTLCVGNAWGESALLLAAGSLGNRSALPSSTIMLKEPISRGRGQASDLNIQRHEIGRVKKELVKLLARHTKQSEEKIENDIRRPMYLTPEAAVEYKLIDKVVYAEGAGMNVVDNLRKKELI